MQGMSDYSSNAGTLSIRQLRGNCEHRVPKPEFAAHLECKPGIVWFSQLMSTVLSLTHPITVDYRYQVVVMRHSTPPPSAAWYRPPAPESNPATASGQST